jgi:hypothetical protein
VGRLGGCARLKDKNEVCPYGLVCLSVKPAVKGRVFVAVGIAVKYSILLARFIGPLLGVFCRRVTCVFHDVFLWFVVSAPERGGKSR